MTKEQLKAPGKPPIRNIIFMFPDSPLTFGDRAKVWKSEADPHALVEQNLKFAQDLDRDGIDAIFSADFLGVNRKALGAQSPFSPPLKFFEPLVWLAAVATITRRIGLVGTLSTQFNEPYNVARRLTSLDNLSLGRAGWNVVTSFSGEENFGATPLPPPEVRYDQAEEFLAVATKLWNSWEPGYEQIRSDGTLVISPDHVKDIGHAGEHYQVKQALDFPPSPQKHPLIVQAGASDRGLEFAGKNAELVFFAAVDKTAATSYYRRLKDLAEGNGRKRSDVRLILGIRIYLGNTRAEAEQAYADLVSELDMQSARTEVLWELPDLDLKDLGLDDPLTLAHFPSEDQIKAYGRRSSRPLIYRGWVEHGLVKTVREFLTKFHNGKGHYELIGSVSEVADSLQEWFEAEALDGLFVLGSNSYSLIAKSLLPLLRERGVVPELASESDPILTLRERLGTRRLPAPLTGPASAI